MALDLLIVFTVAALGLFLLGIVIGTSPGAAMLIVWILALLCAAGAIAALAHHCFASSLTDKRPRP